MRTIKHTLQFKRDYKREKKSGHHPKLDKELLAITKKLVSDKPLPAKNRDHALKW